jgi:hypothetical protein
MPEEQGTGISLDRRGWLNLTLLSFHFGSVLSSWSRAAVLPIIVHRVPDRSVSDPSLFFVKGAPPPHSCQGGALEHEKGQGKSRRVATCVNALGMKTWLRGRIEKRLCRGEDEVAGECGAEESAKETGWGRRPSSPGTSPGPKVWHPSQTQRSEKRARCNGKRSRGPGWVMRLLVLSFVMGIAWNTWRKLHDDAGF